MLNFLGLTMKGRKEKRHMRTFAIANQKGGVGKTALCFHVGGVLAKKGKRTLIVDMDQQENISSAFFDDLRSLKYTVADLLLDGDIPIDEAVRETGIPNLSILPANQRLRGLGKKLLRAGYSDPQFLLLEKLEGLQKKRFDYILIDCPPSLGDATRMALVASQGVIIPVVCQKFAVMGLKQITAFIGKIRESSNPELEFSGLAINFFKKVRKAEREYLESLREIYQDKVFQTAIGDYAEYQRAVERGLPISFHAPSSKQAKDIKRLAKEIFHV